MGEIRVTEEMLVQAKDRASDLFYFRNKAENGKGFEVENLDYDLEIEVRDC